MKKRDNIVKLKWGNKYNDPKPSIDYEPMHKSYGKAEFEICPIFKYGKLKKVLIFPRQQQTKVICYELPAFDQTSFDISSWTHKGVELPKIWHEFWCKEHKTICHRVYVPNNTNRIEFDSLSTLSIRFVKKGDK